MRSISLGARLVAAALLLAPLATAQVSEKRQAELRKMADALQPSVERIRGLKFETDVPKGIQTEKELLAYMEVELDKETSADEFEQMSCQLAALGLAPRDLDLRELLLELLAEQIAGFYDPSTKKLYLIARDAKKSDDPMKQMEEQMMKMFGTSTEEIYMAHELCHALEDQHFELLTLDLEKLRDSDRLTASKCLIEGTATVLMMEYLLGKMGMDPGMMKDQDIFGENALSGASPVLERTPEIIKQQLMFPYVQGMKFVSSIKESGGWKAVNEVFSNPPASTEQTLHPEKYAGANKDMPTLLTLADLAAVLGDGWKDEGHDTLGELGVRILLQESLGKATAERVAAGWDGDVFQVFQGSNGQLACVLATTWDTDPDAEEFFAAAAQYFLKRHPATEVEKTPHRIAWSVDGHAYAVVRSDKDVHVLLGLPQDDSADALTALGQTTRVEHAGGIPNVGKIPIAGDEPATDTEPAAAAPEGWTRDARGVLTHTSGARIAQKRFEVGDKAEDSLFEALVGALREGVQDFRVISKKPARIAGRIVRTIEFTGTDNGAPTRHEQIFFKIGSEAILLSWSTPETSVEATRPGWDEVKRTFSTK